MSNYNPRVIAQSLDDLQEELTRWSSTASDTLSDAANNQRHEKEEIERALHRAAILKDHAEDDQAKFSKTSSSVESALEKSNTGKSIAIATSQEAEKALHLAKSTLAKWQTELKKALEWLARAEDRLAKAIHEYNRALTALRSAESNLRSAEARLRNCQSDRERSNCNGEVAAVNRAIGEVAAARRWVRTAEVEVTAAKEEVAQAKARVACCKQAVAFSTEAVQLADEGKTKATEALNSAERSLEFAESANRALQVAGTKVNAEMEAAEKTMSEAQVAQSFTDEAALHLRNADRAEDSAQNYSTSARKELEHRVQLLYELNRPSLGGSVRAVSLSVEGTHGYPYQKARKDFMQASLSDSNVANYIKGWIQQEVNRVGNSSYWRSPPGYDVGHKIAGVDRADNFQWENSDMNRSKGAKFKR